jgi:hypothetical protein
VDAAFEEDEFDPRESTLGSKMQYIPDKRAEQQHESVNRLLGKPDPGYEELG